MERMRERGPAKKSFNLSEIKIKNGILKNRLEKMKMDSLRWILRFAQNDRTSAIRLDLGYGMGDSLAALQDGFFASLRMTGRVRCVWI